MARRPLPAPAKAVAALAAAVLVGALPSPARAAEPQQPSFAPPEEDTGTERPPAPDQRTGHVYMAFGVGAVGPVGSLGPNIPTQSVLGVGRNFGGIFGVGVSRHATLQVSGDVVQFSSPGSCRVGCTGQSYAVGLGVTYHLAQGMAFDPWGSFGMAYRPSIFQVTAPDITLNAGRALVSQSYLGFDVARIAFGGDFYPFPWGAVGSFVEADVGTNLRRPAPLVALPPNVTDGPRTYGYFQIGVRIAFDPMRRGSLPRGKAAASAAFPPGM